MPLLQCLFCNHVNPGAASFCNECGSQLDLQPCGQCGAVDSRHAKSCYKCGTPFPVPVIVPDLDTLLKPVAYGDPLDYASRIEASVAGAKAMHPHPDQRPGSTYRQLTVGAMAADMLLQTRPSRSSWLVPGIGVSLVVLAALFAIFYQRPVTTAPRQAGVPMAPVVMETSAIATAPPPSLSEPPSPPEQAAQAAQAEPVEPLEPPEPPEVVPTAPTTVAEAPAAKLAARPAPARAAAPVTRPAPVVDTPPIPRRARPLVQDCSPDLATLGLCNP